MQDIQYGAKDKEIGNDITRNNNNKKESTKSCINVAQNIIHDIKE